MSYTCTCRPPPVIDLTEEFFLHDKGNGACKRSNDHDTSHKDNTLLSSLRRCGWAFVKLHHCGNDGTATTSNQNHRFLPLLQNHKSWSQTLHGLFLLPKASTTEELPPLKVPGGIYRQAESGSSDASQGVEPKESWEVQRCRNRSNRNMAAPKGDNNDARYVSSFSCLQQQHVLYDFMDMLHAIAVTVRRSLSFPENILLYEREIDTDDEACPSPSSSVQSSVDLMRAFFYHKVPDNASRSGSNNNNNTVTLGSSPHTDWGSFTVVWQDDVGGLETFCHACQKWNPVQLPDEGTDDEAVSFVVHLSDITSLALGLAGTRLTNSGEDDAKPKTTAKVTSFPSPRHRVVSPVEQTRVSLVYFAYPPPQQSVAQVSESLRDWCQRYYHPDGFAFSQTALSIPFQDYYLLQNQSSVSDKDDDNHKNNPTSLAMAQLERIQDLPLRDVLEDKWNQVQRSY